MASTSFTNGVTLTDAAWFNDVNDGIYKGTGITGLSTVASATTPDIFATTVSGVINYTGTTTCTGFTAAPSAGARRVLICAGAAVFTAGANMLIDGVASAANLTCAAGDKVYVYAFTTTQFYLSRVAYAGASNGLVLIQRQTPSAVATCDFTTGISSTYDEYLFTFTDVRPATAGVGFWCRFSQDGGSSYLTGASDYAYASQWLGDVTAASTSVATGDTKIIMAVNVDNAATNSVCGEMRLFSPSGTANYKKTSFNNICRDNTTDFCRSAYGSGLLRLNANAVNGVRFMFSSGNITSGSIALYGLAKS